MIRISRDDEDMVTRAGIASSTDVLCILTYRSYKFAGRNERLRGWHRSEIKSGRVANQERPERKVLAETQLSAARLNRTQGVAQALILQAAA